MERKEIPMSEQQQEEGVQSISPVKPLYAWYQNTNTSDLECVLTDTLCTYDSLGDPVPFCSLSGNASHDFCISMKNNPIMAYSLLGCYNTPDCGGNFTMSNPFDTQYKYSSLGSFCSEEHRAMCDPNLATNDEINKNCIQLVDGNMPDVATGKTYCFLGVKNYDPCHLSNRNAFLKRNPDAIDYCPRACFTPQSGCCPGSFGSPV